MNNKMAYFNGRSMFCGIGISMLFSLTGSSFWIAGILGTIIGCLLLSFVKSVNDNKIIKTIGGFILATVSLIILVNMGHSLYLKETPLSILTIGALLPIYYISRSKKGPLKKTVYIFFIYSIILFFLKIIGLYSHISIENMLPIYPIDVNNVIIGMLMYAILGVVPIMSLNDLKEKRSIICNYLISSLTILTVSFLAISVLGSMEVKLYRYPEYIVLKKIEFLNFVNNVDSFFNFAIILDLVFTTSAGIRNIEIDSKYIKVFLVLFIGIITHLACKENWILLLIYKYIPFVLIILLILLLIPKKSTYKKSE